MTRRVILSPAACLLLVITAFLGAGYSSAHAQSGRHLVFSTYLGGSEPYDPKVNPLTFAQNAACDAQGNTYVTGATTVSDLPGTTNAFQPAPATGSTMSAFVAKYNPAGQLLWCTYLGGDQQSMGVGVAAMPAGGVAVMGLTTSAAPVPFPTTPTAYQPQNNGLSDYFVTVMGVGVAAMPAGGVVVAGLTTSAAPVPFPTTPTAYQLQNDGQSDYFVTVFDANGNLQYSTYLGGSGVEGQLPPYADDQNNGNGVAVDANGLVYVGGMTASSDFPVTANALQNNLRGTRNACLCIIDPTKSGQDSLVYSSFLGGDHDNQGHSVAVNASGSLITLAGFTTSSNFPTTPANAYRSSAPPGGFASNSSNGFVTQFQASQPGSPSTMLYSTYLGADSSTARDDVYGMVMDATGLIVATGRTQSAGFPMTTAGPSIFNSLQAGTTGDEPYLVKIDPSLTGAASLVYSTFLGGGGSSTEPGGSFCTSVGVDALGTAYVGGETAAQGVQYAPSNYPVAAPQNFPYTQNALLPALQDTRDSIFMQISPGGATLGYSTYLGAQDNSSRTYGLAVDPARNIVLTGLTFSNNFPLQNPAQTYPGNGYQNAFVTKFSAQVVNRGALLLLLLDD